MVPTSNTANSAPLGARVVKELAQEFEFEQYIKAFTSSSDRVRHLIFISILASVLVFAAYRNSMTKTWWNTRIEIARVGVRNEVWLNPTERVNLCHRRGPQAARFMDPCDEVARASDLLVFRGKHGETSLKSHLAKLEETRVNEILFVSVPFLGIRFDINDLGAFSAIGLAIISFTLCFAMARQHENLFLSLWKVKQVARTEENPEDGQSRANLLYHALAMAQVFTRPPTLARWKPWAYGRYAIRLILFTPVLVQSLVLANDIKTVPDAWSLNWGATMMTMWMQVLFSLVVLVCTIMSYCYSRAGDFRWRETFQKINPDQFEKDQPSWWRWVKLR
jgi:hypothetical protein